ncbi:hypothetical protein SERLA73DRAFT_73782 [Serpula lacrymans var. lacrymans S7.3]|uniref:Uncharacterized protein n=2 Tax=Serpula lacrymans var. lacrymans TaxID=341189 RepID=F8PWR7_SERL3|nr:hypothetical protein SERLA73DRAFT_73782 [Serpula lacrymans var. lacrymans S7.3]
MQEKEHEGKQKSSTAGGTAKTARNVPLPSYNSPACENDGSGGECRIPNTENDTGRYTQTNVPNAHIVKSRDPGFAAHSKKQGRIYKVVSSTVQFKENPSHDSTVPKARIV